MSRVLSEEVKEIVRANVRVLTGIKCDICGKIVPAGHYCEDENKYFEVTIGHHDWGNDSWESRMHKDICPDCISKFVSDYLTDKKGYDSRYIEVETKYCYARDVEDDDE